MTSTRCQKRRRNVHMFINKAKDGTNNIIGEKLYILRKQTGLSQRKFADQLQLIGLDLDKNAIQRIECGKRFVTDIELYAICQLLRISPNEILHYCADE